MNDTTRAVGGALGVAVLGSALSSAYTAAFTSGMHTALWVAAAILAADALVFDPRAAVPGIRRRPGQISPATHRDEDSLGQVTRR